MWDIAKGVCANVLRFEYSIISIAFHPAGKYSTLTRTYSCMARTYTGCKYVRYMGKEGALSRHLLILICSSLLFLIVFHISSSFMSSLFLFLYLTYLRGNSVSIFLPVFVHFLSIFYHL